MLMHVCVAPRITIPRILLSGPRAIRIMMALALRHRTVSCCPIVSSAVMPMRQTLLSSMPTRTTRTVTMMSMMRRSLMACAIITCTMMAA